MNKCFADCKWNEQRGGVGYICGRLAEGNRHGMNGHYSVTFFHLNSVLTTSTSNKL